MPVADDAAAREEAERLAGLHTADCDRWRYRYKGLPAPEACICPFRSERVTAIAESLARARRDALEEAAAYLEQDPDNVADWLSCCIKAADEMAKALRALAAEPGGKNG